MIAPIVSKQHNVFKIMLMVWVIVGFLSFASSSAESIQGHALLVGCTEYPHLDSTTWLEGPENDVQLMYDLLTNDMFGFSPDRITTLAGWPDDEAQRPTRANIECEFQRLAEVAKPDDQVVILMAGHGSQQPADEDPNDLEPDGLDEIFLPADVKAWDGSQGRVPNSITDDDLREWLAAIRNKGAFVWITIDACHSGTMTRGAPVEQERVRQLPAEVLVPKDVLAAAEKRALRQERTRGGAAASILGLSPEAGDMVAMYAAQSTELAPEKPLPSKADRAHGLFTYTLSEILLQSESTLTYRELIERVNANYRGSGRRQPTPLIEGGALDREVLGLKTWPSRPKMLLAGRDWEKPGTLQLKAGTLHGLTPGSVLAVYPPAGTEGTDRLSGYVEVAAVKPLLSSVKPVEFENMPAPGEDKLVSGSRCEVVFVHYGDLRMKIAVQQQKDAGKMPALPGASETLAVQETYAPGEGPEVIESALQQLDVQAVQLVERVVTAAEANWFIRVVNDEILLIPVSGFSGEEGVPPEFTLGNISQNAEILAEKFSYVLLSIARANNLLKLAAAGSSAKRFRGGVAVNVELIRYKDENDLEGEPVSYETAGRILRPGDLIAFRVENPTKNTIDVTLLFIDSSYGIFTFFPEPGTLDDNRLPPGKILTTPRAEITGDTLGLEQLVTIAVKAEKDRVDFACLEQPSLDRVRDLMSERGTNPLDSPLGKLMQTALFGEGAHRGMKKADVDNYALHLLDWRTMPMAE